ncbi:MAG TPA: GTPase HflX [Clostridiales bacterium]|nr:GTPase HflX [Clostridiales bacterium]HCU55754.1 GTPase HflX [Clostridiales bacterium]
MIHGNTDGIKRALLWRLEKHLGFTDKSSFVSEETLAVITEFTQATGREVSVYLSRTGRVEAISVGDAVKVDALALGKRRGENSKSKIRVIHTHPKGSARLSAADLSALKEMRYDCLAAVGVSAQGANKMEIGYLAPTGVKIIDVSLDGMDHAALLDMIVECDTVGKARGAVKEEINSRCITVGVGDEESLYELKRLAETANYEPVGRIMQKRTTVDSTYYVGSGKIDEIAMEAQIKDAAIVIFDVPLSAVQHAAISERLGRRVIDRGTLILEIFEKHATTAEGRLQVELARLKYTLPLLVGQGESMSRQRGGLYAMGGAGETKLETDRRHIRRRISELTEKLKALEEGRDLRRRKRKQSGIKSVTLLGYTNAGKSTLINAISRSDLYAENKLFATLDSVSRSVWTEEGNYVMTDTVGFIRNLPHTFVEAFKSTLDEVRYADLLIHVVDASSPEMAAQIATVEEVIREIGAEKVPLITVYNKADKAEREEGKLYISAKFGENLEVLKQRIKLALFGEKE